MDENVQNTDSQTAPIEPQTEEAPQEVQEHAETEEVSTQSSSETNVEAKETGDEQTDTPDSEWETEKKRLSGKISKLEKDNNEYLQAKQIYDALNKAATVDPEFQRLANKKLVEQGLLDESAVNQQATQTTPQAGNTPVPSSSDPAVSWARDKMQEEESKKIKFFEDFEEKHPDVTEGDERIIQANRNAISAAARRRMTSGADMEEAYDFAYKQIMNPSALVEEGKLQGLAQAQSAKPVEGASSGGSASSSGGVKLTPEQKSAAELFGVSEEAYAKQLAEN